MSCTTTPVASTLIKILNRKSSGFASHAILNFKMVKIKTEPGSDVPINLSETKEDSKRTRPKRSNQTESKGDHEDTSGQSAKEMVDNIKTEPNSEAPTNAPANWLETIENIKKVRQRYPAPVDSMGCDQAHDRRDKDINQRFQVLLSLMLSSQTKDPITWAAVQRLKDKGLGNVDGMLEAKEKDIEDLIFPVGFYRRKAEYLKKTVAILREQYNGDIPNTIKDLCKLPGVGPKMAHLCMLEAWNIVTGIGVDTHVHRIAARLNWVPKTGIKTPEDTRRALESWLPRQYWREINHLLVGFGQTICLPVGPKCHECYNNLICPSAGMKKASKGSAPKKESTKREVIQDGPVQVKAEPIQLKPEGEAEEEESSVSARVKRTRRK